MYKSDWDCFIQTLKTEGLTGINKGMVITILREVPGYMGLFASYEMLKSFFMRHNKDGKFSTFGTMVSGSIAGVISWTCSYP